MKSLYLKVAVCLCALLLIVSCGKKKAQPVQEVASVDYVSVAIPNFNADSAYSYVARQLAFGYRIPGTKSHQQCAEYLVDFMRGCCDTVIVQDFNTTLWDQRTVRGKNIIASLDPENPRRIYLAAHWDSRAWADQDPDERNHKTPIPGANDGASGVAVMMEMARVMASMPLSVGVDFVFFDVEDQGTPDWADIYEDDTWCKGSQYWASNPHRPYYSAVYGVLFDMVGTDRPRFTKEQFSMTYAQDLTNKIWRAASVLGYGDMFVDVKSDPILDDHLYVNRIANIPTLDIVQNSVGCSFYPYWHTVKDDLDAINATTLKMVADVTLKVIYGDYSK